MDNRIGCDEMKQKKLVEKEMELIRDTLDRPDLPEIVRKKGSNCFSRTEVLLAVIWSCSKGNTGYAP